MPEVEKLARDLFEIYKNTALSIGIGFEESWDVLDAWEQDSWRSVAERAIKEREEKQI